MTNLRWKTIAAGLVASLTLVGVAHAQMGQMKGMPNKGGMVGQMKMSGTCDMGGKSTPVQCNMMPAGSHMSVMGGKGMTMTKPMKMAGTMTMMGQTYHCTMTMMPQGK